MAGSAGSVFVDLLLRDDNYRAGWQRARNYTHAGSRQIQGDMGRIRQSFEGVLNPVNNLGTAIRNLGVTIAAAFSVQKIIQYSDTWKQLEGRLKVVQGDFENIGDTQGRLFEIAQKTRQPLENILGFYSRLKQFIPEVEREQYNLFNTTEGVATALALTGEISESATAAMIQLTQGIGTNFEAAGQELRSLQEQAPRLTTAIQKSFGDGSKTLQQLVKDGILTRETFLKIFDTGSVEFKKLQEELSKMPLTVAQAFQRLDNAFLKFIGQNKEVQNVTGSLSMAINWLAENLDIATKSVLLFSSILVARAIPSMVGFLAVINSFRAGVAIIGLFSTSLVYLQLAARGFITMLGGWPVIIAASLTAVIVFRKEIKEWADETVLFGQNLGKVWDDVALGARIIFAGVGAVIAGFVTGTISAMETLDAKLIVQVYKIIGRLNNIPGVNINTDNLLADLSQPGVFEASQRDVLQSFKDSWNKVSNDFSDDLSKSLFPSILGEGMSKSGASAGGSPTGTGTGDDKDKGAKSIEKWLVKQKEALMTLRQEADYIGKTTIEINKLKDARQFEAEIAEKSVGLKGAQLQSFREQAEAIKILRQEAIQTNYDISRNASTGFQNFATQYVEDATNMAKNVESVLQSAFQSAEDAFVEFTKTGKLNFREFANSIIEDLIRIEFRKSAANLIGSITGAGGLSGLVGGLFGGSSGSSVANPNIAGTKYMFADGGYLGPGQWGIAGEAGAELLYGGKTGVSVFNQDQMGRGGNTYNIDARGADQGAVRRLEQALMSLAGPGVVTQRVQNSQVRGEL